MSGMVPNCFCHWHLSDCPSDISFPPFLLYPLLESFHVMLWGWLDWTRSEYPTTPDRVTIQDHEHNPSQPRPLTCWDLGCVTEKNSLLGIQRGWYMIWGCWLSSHPTCCLESPCPRASGATWAGYNVWVGLMGNRAKQKQAEPGNRESWSFGDILCVFGSKQVWS